MSEDDIWNVYQRYQRLARQRAHMIEDRAIAKRRGRDVWPRQKLTEQLTSSSTAPAPLEPQKRER